MRDLLLTYFDRLVEDHSDPALSEMRTDILRQLSERRTAMVEDGSVAASERASALKLPIQRSMLRPHPDGGNVGGQTLRE